MRLIKLFLKISKPQAISLGAFFIVGSEVNFWRSWHNYCAKNFECGSMDKK
jgi:hypothetical protein